VKRTPDDASESILGVLGIFAVGLVFAAVKSTPQSSTMTTSTLYGSSAQVDTAQSQKVKIKYFMAQKR
jgi:hypothetical protein